jgi:hypothetical protein
LVVAGVVMTTPETVGTAAAVVAMFPMVIDDTATGVGAPITDESPDPAKAAGAMATALSAATPPMMARIFFIFSPWLIKPMPELSKPDNYLGGWRTRAIPMMPSPTMCRSFECRGHAIFVDEVVIHIPTTKPQSLNKPQPH